MEATGVTRLPWRLCGVSEEGDTSPSEGHQVTASWIWLCCSCFTKCRTREEETFSKKSLTFHQPVNLDMVWLVTVNQVTQDNKDFCGIKCNPRCLEQTTWICWAHRPSVVYFQLTEGCSRLSFSSPQRKKSFLPAVPKKILVSQFWSLL